MLDDTLKTQLQAYLQKLQRPIRLIASLDGGEKSAELRACCRKLPVCRSR